LYTITGDVLTLTGISTESLDMLALVDLLWWGTIPTSNSSFGWIDAWELNPELGSLWLKASMIGGRRAVLLIIYTLPFALQLRKSTENLSQGSRAVLGTASCVDFAAL